MSGVALGALAGIGFGFFQAVNRRANAAVDVYRGTFALLTVAAVLLAVISLATENVSELLRAPMGSLAAFAAASFVHFFIGWTLLGLSQQRLGAARTGALLGTTPLFGAIAAAVVLGEVPTSLQMLALVVVVIGVIAIALSRQAPAGGSPAAGTPGGATGTGPQLAGGGRAGTATPVGPVRGAVPVLALLAPGLGTALCWSISPLLIREGLEGLPSPLLGVTIGMAVTALAYGSVVTLVRRGRQQAVLRPTRGLLLLAGILVGVSIWLQWMAFDLARVAVVLAVMQLSAPVVVLVSPLVSGDPLERGGGWLWAGVTLIVGGAVLLVLTP